MSLTIPAAGAIRAAYDRTASCYDEKFRALQRIKYRAVLGRRAERLRAWLARGPVLDLGCGTSLLSEFASDCGVEIEGIIGVDLSQPMLRAGRSRCPRLVNAAIEELPFASRSFAAVAAFTSLAIAPRSSAGDRPVTELARVLMPGADFAATVLAATADRIPMQLRMAGLHCDLRFRCGQDVGFVGHLAGR